jgi:hypothetical protein
MVVESGGDVMLGDFDWPNNTYRYDRKVRFSILSWKEFAWFRWLAVYIKAHMGLFQYHSPPTWGAMLFLLWIDTTS